MDLAEARSGPHRPLRKLSAPPRCDSPAAVTLYGHSGQVLSHTGNTRNLNRITRPINHGNPFAYKSQFHRPAGATGKH
jgi:hypothetical protein